MATRAALLTAGVEHVLGSQQHGAESPSGVHHEDDDPDQLAGEATQRTAQRASRRWVRVGPEQRAHVVCDSRVAQNTSIRNVAINIGENI